MDKTTTRGTAGRLFEWYAVAIGVVITLIGLALAGGGGYLLILGGSFYYLPAGLALIVAGVLLTQLRRAGAWLYLAVFVATVAWALWEVGFEPWPLLPRVFAPFVLLVLVLIAVPALGGRTVRTRTGATVLAGGLMAAALAHAIGPGSVLAQVEAPLAAPEGGPDSLAPLPAPETTEAPVLVPVPVQVAAPVVTPTVDSDWPAYGGSKHAERSSPLAEITRDNVATLERVWTYRTGDMPSETADGKYAAETTPLKIGDSLYLCSAKNILISLDAATGEERWRFDPEVSDDAIPYSASCRGVAHYVTPGAAEGSACAARVIQGTLDGRLMAVDAADGQPCADFGDGGSVNLLDGIGHTVPGWFAVTSPPTIVRGVAVIGHQVKDGERREAPSGVVRGYDAVTGALRWAWDMGRPGETGAPAEGETYTRGTPNMWTIASGDDELGLVYLPMGNSSVDYYGAMRSEEENRFSTSLVALDVTTGEVAWHFQTVRYDVWDYDLGSQATLIDFPGRDGMVPALVLPSKQGDLYLLDRRTGEPLTPVEDRPVPKGGVEPENLAETQPFSLYHTLAKRDLTERDMWGMSPLDQLFCRIQFRRAAYDGIYTPPTADRAFIQYPGYNGGSDWGGIAIDADRGVIIANYNDMPNHNRLIPREAPEAENLVAIDDPARSDNPPPDGVSPQIGAPYAIDVNAGWRVPLTGLLCKQPPYGGIRAIELATGRTLWDEPIGTARRNGPFGIPSMLPIPIGTPNNGGPIITAGGLVFVAAATDDLIRAIDIETGDVLWEDALPAGGQATPITYEIGGRQFLVMMAGGHHFMETPIGDHVIAYALPARGATP